MSGDAGLDEKVISIIERWQRQRKLC